MPRLYVRLAGDVHSHSSRRVLGSDRSGRDGQPAILPSSRCPHLEWKGEIFDRCGLNQYFELGALGATNAAIARLLIPHSLHY